MYGCIYVCISLANKFVRSKSNLDLTHTLLRTAQHQTEIVFGAKSIGKPQQQSKFGSIQGDSELISLYVWWGVEGEDLFENGL